MILAGCQLLLALTNCLLSCEASKSKESKGLRIVGGEEANILDAPFIAALLKVIKKKGIHICGSVIVSKRHLLTAAHCLVEDLDTEGYEISDPKSFLVSTGSKYAERGKTTKINDFFVHPNYDNIELVNDMGAIVLKEDLRFDDKTKPAKLPIGSFQQTSAMLEKLIKANTVCKAYGWGVTKERAYSGLRVVGLHLIPFGDCERIVARKLLGRVYGKLQLCTMDQGKKDACQGDSGGPLSCGGVIWGLVSWGEGCARPGNPSIFSRTDVALKWLQRKVRVSLQAKSSSGHRARPSMAVLILIACFFQRITLTVFDG